MGFIGKAFAKRMPTGDIDWSETRKPFGMYKSKGQASEVPKSPLPGQITKGAMTKSTKTFVGAAGKTIRRTTYRQRRRGSMVSKTGSVKQALLNKMAGESLLG
jgi:hypothetical protein